AIIEVVDDINDDDCISENLLNDDNILDSQKVNLPLDVAIKNLNDSLDIGEEFLKE
ncbi:9537_t:CDS:1, partial [Racocetra persica]